MGASSSAKSAKPETAINIRLKEVRLALGMPQAQFCRGIFLSNGHYAEIELENRRVNDRVIKLVQAIYGVNEGWLRTGKGKMFDRAPDPRLAQLIREFEELPPDWQDCVLEQIAALKKLQKKAADAP